MTLPSSAGWEPSTPESMMATDRPAPVNPACHAWGAPIWAVERSNAGANHSSASTAATSGEPARRCSASASACMTTTPAPCTSSALTSSWSLSVAAASATMAGLASAATLSLINTSRVSPAAGAVSAATSRATARRSLGTAASTAAGSTSGTGVAPLGGAASSVSSRPGQADSANNSAPTVTAVESKALRRSSVVRITRRLPRQGQVVRIGPAGSSCGAVLIHRSSVVEGISTLRRPAS